MTKFDKKEGVEKAKFKPDLEPSKLTKKTKRYKKPTPRYLAQYYVGRWNIGWYDIGSNKNLTEAIHLTRKNVWWFKEKYDVRVVDRHTDEVVFFKSMKVEK